MAVCAVREAVEPHFFHPTLQERGDVEPEEGELEDDHVGATQTILLCRNVDGLVGVERIETEHFGTGEFALEGVENAAVGHRVVEVGVAADDESV